MLSWASRWLLWAVWCGWASRWVWASIPSTSTLPLSPPHPPSARLLSLHQEPRGDVYRLSKKTNLTGRFERDTSSFSAPLTIPSNDTDEVMVRTMREEGNGDGDDGDAGKSGQLFVPGQVPAGVTVTTSPGGRHVIQIPPGMKWRDVEGSLTNPEARKTWREIFNVVLSLRREEEKKLLMNVTDNPLTITPVRSADVNIPMSITLPEIEETIKTADLKRLKKMKKRLRKLIRQARRNQRKLLLRVPSSVGNPPPGISVISASGGEQVIQIPNTVKWSEVRGSFPSAAENEVWRQIFRSRDASTKMIRESVDEVLAGNWLVSDEIEKRSAQIRMKGKVKDKKPSKNNNGKMKDKGKNKNLMALRRRVKNRLKKQYLLKMTRRKMKNRMKNFKRKMKNKAKKKKAKGKIKDRKPNQNLVKIGNKEMENKIKIILCLRMETVSKEARKETKTRRKEESG
ncbi:uncharacterized protein LOC123518703 [Portunus trituberculatus]|uniref:uncharacterized protein LOC123518703 n=1 Tax=Portunus trituberculatus TaxID=210409 RepID=UPI001E1CBD92|nr:uncharacterized protein LOC123518703 [Portunus trituberculatus]